MANPAPRWPAGGANLRPLKHFSAGMRHRNASVRVAVAALAGTQHGVVAHWQLITGGVSRSMVQRWFNSGWLHRVHLGVYAVGHAALTGDGRWMAGLLACGPGAVLSHQPAGALLDLRRSASPITHVTTPRRAKHTELRVHRIRHLHAEDVVERRGIPV